MRMEGTKSAMGWNYMMKGFDIERIISEQPKWYE